MTELAQKDDTQTAFEQMQDDYLKSLDFKFNTAKNSLDNLLSDSITDVNGVMMSLGVGLA